MTFDIKEFLTENKIGLNEAPTSTSSPEYKVFLKAKDGLSQAYKDILNSPDPGAISVFVRLVKLYRTAHSKVYGQSV